VHGGQFRAPDPAVRQGERRVAARLDPAAGYRAGVQFQAAGADQHGGLPGVLPGQGDALDPYAGRGDLQYGPPGGRGQHPYGVLRPVLRQQAHRAVEEQLFDVLARGDPDLVAVAGGAHGGGDAAVRAAALGGDPVHGGGGGHVSSNPSMGETAVTAAGGCGAVVDGVVVDGVVVDGVVVDGVVGVVVDGGNGWVESMWAPLVLIQ
jgi:hypothetical protein